MSQCERRNLVSTGTGPGPLELLDGGQDPFACVITVGFLCFHKVMRPQEMGAGLHWANWKRTRADVSGNPALSYRRRNCAVGCHMFLVALDYTRKVRGRRQPAET